MTHLTPNPDAMSPEQDAFYRSFGERITVLRKERGLTQTQLGVDLGVSQQQVVAFEKGRRRVPLASLPILARALGVSLEELVGEEPAKKPAKRGPTPRLQEQMERISQLPRGRQRFVLEMIDAVLLQANQ
jgi:transcriptional regulator with XRE-family HTH domain